MKSGKYRFMVKLNEKKRIGRAGWKIFNPSQPNQSSGTCCRTTDTEVKICHKMKPFQSGAVSWGAKSPKM